MLTISDLISESWTQAEKSGWHEEERTFGDVIALMHSELSEALEEFRKGLAPDEIYYSSDKPDKPEGVPIEFADAIIRIADTAATYDIDLEQALRLKTEYNRKRPYRHGGKKL